MCTGFSWPGFGSGGEEGRCATGVTSLRSYWKLLPFPMEPLPAGPKTDLLLAKAEPINDSGSASVIAI